MKSLSLLFFALRYFETTISYLVACFANYKSYFLALHSVTKHTAGRTQRLVRGRDVLELLSVFFVLLFCSASGYDFPAGSFWVYITCGMEAKPSC